MRAYISLLSLLSTTGMESETFDPLGLTICPATELLLG
jgi:hypothetical protein